MTHIKGFNEFVNESANNTPDEQLFLDTLGFKDFEEIQRRYTRNWYDGSTYGGGKRTFIPNIIPMKIIASAVSRYMKSNQNVTVRPNMSIFGGMGKPFFTFIVKQNGKEVAIHFDDGEITHYGEDMTTPAITVHYDGRMETIWGDDRFRRKFGDTDWHENEMEKMSDRLLQVLDDVL